MAWCQQMWIWWVFLRESLNFMSMGAKMILSFALGHVTCSSKCFVQSKSFNITKPSKSSYNLISPGHKNTSSLKHTLRWICTISQPHFFSKKFFFHFRGSSSPIMEKHPLTNTWVMAPTHCSHCQMVAYHLPNSECPRSPRASARGNALVFIGRTKKTCRVVVKSKWSEPVITWINRPFKDFKLSYFTVQIEIPREHIMEIIWELGMIHDQIV